MVIYVAIYCNILALKTYKTMIYDKLISYFVVC